MNTKKGDSVRNKRQLNGGTLLGISVVLGLLAAVLRMRSIATAYDTQTGLFASGNGYTIALIAVCVLFVFAAFVLSLQPVADRSGHPGALGPHIWALGLPAVLALAASVYFDLDSSGLLTSGATVRYTQVVLCLFSLFAAYCAVRVLQALRTAALTMRHSFFMVMPIFWASYWLLLDFSVHSANPVILIYFFDLIAIICGVLSLYLSAGFFFGIVKNRKLLFISLSGIFFALLVLGGRALCALTLGSYPVEAADWGHILRVLFILLYQGVLLIATKDGFLPGVQKTAQEPVPTVQEETDGDNTAADEVAADEAQDQRDDPESEPGDVQQ